MNSINLLSNFSGRKYKAQKWKHYTSFHTKPTNNCRLFHNITLWQQPSYEHQTSHSLQPSIKAKRICSEEKKLENFNKRIATAIVEKGYPKALVKNQIHLAQYTSTIGNLKKSKFTSLYHKLSSRPTKIKHNFVGKLQVLPACTHMKTLFTKSPWSCLNSVNPKLWDPNLPK